MGNENMKFKIVLDRGNILRVRAGKNAFTKEQGYGLTRFLSEKKGIKTVNPDCRICQG